MPLDGAVLSFEWVFDALSNRRTRITQRIVLSGDNAGAYADQVRSGFASTLPDGMKRIANALVSAERAARRAGCRPHTSLPRAARGRAERPSCRTARCSSSASRAAAGRSLYFMSKRVSPSACTSPRSSSRRSPASRRRARRPGSASRSNCARVDRRPAALRADARHQRLVVRPELLARLLVGGGDVAGRVDADRQRLVPELLRARGRTDRRTARTAAGCRR